MRSESLKSLALPSLRAAIRRSISSTANAGSGSVLGLPGLQLVAAEAENSERAGHAAGGVLQAMQLGDCLRRIDVVEQRFQHGGRRARLGLGRCGVEEARQRLLGLFQTLLLSSSSAAGNGSIASSMLPGQSANRSRMMKKLPRLLLIFRLRPARSRCAARSSITGEWNAAARLRDLVLAIGTPDLTAAVDVEGLAETLPGHRRAFDVPARTAGPAAGGRRPRARRASRVSTTGRQRDSL